MELFALTDLENLLVSMKNRYLADVNYGLIVFAANLISNSALLYMVWLVVLWEPLTVNYLTTIS
jgi:hypothetical protein